MFQKQQHIHISNFIMKLILLSIISIESLRVTLPTKNMLYKNIKIKKIILLEILLFIIKLFIKLFIYNMLCIILDYLLMNLAATTVFINNRIKGT